MKRLDEGKISLVQFLASIRYKRGHGRNSQAQPHHFAHFSPQTRTDETTLPEERLLVRSVN